jgi:hypothetical protein
MPTILRSGAFAVRVYPNDHAPPHVHVVSAGGAAKVALGKERSRLLTVVGLARAEVGDALRLVAAHRDLCLRRWREIHGDG